jgi:hypothetical protein
VISQERQRERVETRLFHLLWDTTLLREIILRAALIQSEIGRSKQPALKSKVTKLVHIRMV